VQQIENGRVDRNQAARSTEIGNH